MNDRPPRWRDLAAPGPALLVMLAPLALLSLNIVPGRPLLPLGAPLAVAAVVLPLPLIAGRVRLPDDRGLGILIAAWLVPGVLSLASVIWSPQPALSLQRVLLVFVPGVAVLILVAADRRPWQTFRLVSRAVVAVAAALALLGLVLLAVGNTRLTSEGFVQVVSLGPIDIGQRLMGAPPFLRITSLAGNPNGLATWLVFGLVLLPAAWPGVPRRWWRWTVGAVMAAALLLTMSRTGLAAALLALLVYQSLRHPGRIVPLIVAVALTALGLAIMVMVLREAGLDVTTTDRFSLSLSAREEAWLPLLDAWRQRPWTGIGFGIGYEELLRARGLRFGAHSGHLVLLAEIGLLGYLGLLAVWGRGIVGGLGGLRRCRLPVPIGASCVALLVAYFAQQFFEASILRFTFASYFWLYLVAVAALARGAAEEA